MKIKFSWKWFIIVSIVLFIFIVFVLPQADSYLKEMTGQSKSPDTSLIYSAEDLYQMAESYGQSGREAYVKLRWTFDIIWPLLYTWFLVLWTIKLSEHSSTYKFAKYFFLIPIIGMVFDFLENIGAAIVMYRYPLKSGIIGSITPIMTFLKWISLFGSLLVIIVLMIIVGLNRRRGNEQ